MEKIATIGLDIAKSVFQVHGIDAAGEVVVRKAMARPSLCWTAPTRLETIGNAQEHLMTVELARAAA